MNPYEKVFQAFEKAYLKRCKYSSPESKLQWLAAALEFTREVNKMRVKKTEIAFL